MLCADAGNAQLICDDEPESNMPRPSQTILDIHPSRHIRTSSRRMAFGRLGAIASTLISVLLLGQTISASPVSAQLLLLPEDAGPQAFPVSRLELSYAKAHPDQPSLNGLLPVVVELFESPQGWRAAREDEPTTKLEIGGPTSRPIILTPTGLAKTLRALVEEIHATGLYGVDVRPSNQDINLDTERDLRPAGQDRLRVIVSVGRVSRVRSIAVGDRIDDEWKIDHELHEGIRTASPLMPSGGVDDDTTNLLDRHELEDYLHRLNRHPGRRVEAALSPDEEPGAVVLDYRVAESKPWFVYAQTSNTGTGRSSRWQTRVGAVHRQLTDRDDILSFEYLNAGADVNGVRAKYEAPFFGPKRPDWMNRRTGDPAWIDWFPREKIPWWGIDRLRWDAEISFGRFEAGSSSTAGFLNDTVASEQLQGGGRLVYEALQHKNFFVDLWAGIRFKDVRVRNKVNSTLAKALFVLPRIGIHAQQINAISNFALDFGVEGSVRQIETGDLENLGRPDVDSKYAKLDFNLGYSTYLEPVLFPEAFRDPESRRSSTLAHELSFGLRGQYAFDYRLAPQASQIIGGLYSVRGYDQSEAVGDTVVIATLEYRFHIPRALPIMREPLDLPLLGDFRATPQQVYGRPDWDLTFRAFLDVGRAIRNANNASRRASDGLGVPEFEPDETLIGVGVGAEFQFRSNLRARLDWALPLTGTPGENDNDEFEFGENSEIHLLFSILY